LVAPSGIPGTTAQIDKLFSSALLMLLVGPAIAGLLLTGLLDGRAGWRSLRASLFAWRVGVRWYAIALLATPLLVLATLFLLSLTSSVYLPALFSTGDVVSLLLTGVAIGLMGGFIEELGWTGFAVPRLRRRFGILTTGLIVGVLWGVWHFLVTYWASGDVAGRLSLPDLIPPIVFYVAVLPVYRVLMVWVYDCSGSILIAMLMHASLTASTLFILQPAATGMALTIYYLVLAGFLWIVAVAVRSWRAAEPVETAPGLS
jgi:membrane protease YdiL (CAAX protease family)